MEKIAIVAEKSAYSPQVFQNQFEKAASPIFAIRAEKRLFSGTHHQSILDFQGVNFQNGL